MHLNSRRFDLSPWLIHFFRKVDLEDPSAPPVPEDFGWSNITEDTHYTALFMLRCALRSGRLWATWSVREGVRTIYGPSPAVCFTEMPLAAFLETSEAREARGEAISSFALLFPKTALYALGTNPVIYGLSDRSASLPRGVDGAPRIIDPNLLPLNEQYRYVTYNPIRPRLVDWTHEREWRWPFRGDTSTIETELTESGIVKSTDNIPGLDINAAELRGAGVLVDTPANAAFVIHDILSLVDRHKIGSAHYSFVLCATDLPALDILRSPDEVDAAIANASIDLAPFFTVTPHESTQYQTRFDALVAAASQAPPTADNGERGGAWLWLLDNTHRLTRVLLAAGRIRVSASGRYLVDLSEFDNAPDLRQRQDMIAALAALVSAEFTIDAGYFAVLGSYDPDALPFYPSDHLDNRMYFNVSWDDTDVDSDAG